MESTATDPERYLSGIKNFYPTTIYRLSRFAVTFPQSAMVFSSGISVFPKVISSYSILKGSLQVHIVRLISVSLHYSDLEPIPYTSQ